MEHRPARRPAIVTLVLALLSGLMLIV